MKIAVIGQGYIGLPTTLVLADSGWEVIGVDNDQDKIDQLNRGEVTFKEEGLQELFDSALSKNLSFQVDYPEVDIYIIAVPSPYKDDNKKVDPSYLIASSEIVAGIAPKDAIVVIESTISPGVTDEYVRPALESTGKKLGEDIHVIHAPERIIPGNMLKELYGNSRTIGADDKEAALKVKDVYASFCTGEIIITDIRTAELSKVVENTYRDINIAFANELSRICHRAGVDVHEVIEVANHHPRVNILTPGPGVGGHCIPVDPWFLVGDFPEDANLIRQAREVNDSQPLYIWKLAKEEVGSVGLPEDCKVGLYGLTYKENVDDTRMSPTLQLLEQITAEEKASTIVYDPYITEDIVDNQYHDLEQFINDCDLVLIMVKHDEIADKAELLSDKAVFDTKGIREVRKAADNYFTL